MTRAEVERLVNRLRDVEVLFGRNAAAGRNAGESADTLLALLARAEAAERERDAAVAAVAAEREACAAVAHDYAMEAASWIAIGLNDQAEASAKTTRAAALLIHDRVRARGPSDALADALRQAEARETERIAEAAREAMQRYPADHAMRWAWMIAATGLLPGEITPEDEEWAKAAILAAADAKETRDGS